MKHKLFVYGTLKKGHYFHRDYLEGYSDFLGKHKTSDDYIIYIDGIPFMVEEIGSGPVIGELYEIDEVTLYQIDTLEGHPQFYTRTIIDIENLETGEKTTAWAYVHPNIFKHRKDKIKENEYF